MEPRKVEHVEGRFDGRVAVVTGAASGMGRAIVRRLAAEGAAVLAVDRDPDGLASTVEGLAGVEPCTADLGSRGACLDVVARAVARVGRLDVLGNVAGILQTAHAPDITEEQYRRVMAVNLDAPFFLAQAALPHLLEAGGSVVNIASNAAIQGVPYALAYSMSKGGIIQLTRSLAVEFLKSSLRVNCIAPAGTNTNIATGVEWPEGMDPDLRRRMGGLRGLTEPDEVAALFAFLASDEARSITGAVYVIDNGLTIS